MKSIFVDFMRKIRYSDRKGHRLWKLNLRFLAVDTSLNGYVKCEEKRPLALSLLRDADALEKADSLKNLVENERSIHFSSPEPKTTAQDQRNHFALQMERLLNVPALQYAHDWDPLFYQLSLQTRTGKLILVFDEINWMGSLDHTFLGKLKTAWDELFKPNPQLILILSGSMSVWIEHNILSSTGFLDTLRWK